MRLMKVIVTERAMYEQDALYEYICDEVQAPLTAYTYLVGLEKEVERLGKIGAALPVDYRLSEKLGIEVRRSNYKKMTIIFSVESDAIYVHHIIPQSIII